MGWLYALHARSSIARGRNLQALYMSTAYAITSSRSRACVVDCRPTRAVPHGMICGPEKRTHGQLGGGWIGWVKRVWILHRSSWRWKVWVVSKAHWIRVAPVRFALVQQQRRRKLQAVVAARADDLVGEDVNGVAVGLGLALLQKAGDRRSSVQLLTASRERGIVGEELQRVGGAALVYRRQEVNERRAACCDAIRRGPGRR